MVLTVSRATLANPEGPDKPRALRRLKSPVSMLAIGCGGFRMSGLFDVRGEVIFITGASQGLGRQFARVLSAHGAGVALAARQTGKLKALEDEITGRGERAAAVAMDVTSTASIGEAPSGPTPTFACHLGATFANVGVKGPLAN